MRPHQGGCRGHGDRRPRGRPPHHRRLSSRALRGGRPDRQGAGAHRSPGRVRISRLVAFDAAVQPGEFRPRRPKRVAEHRIDQSPGAARRKGAACRLNALLRPRRRHLRKAEGAPVGSRRLTAMATLAEALERALQLHERGRLDEAEALYRRILVHAPDHAETLHLLGALAHQRGQHEAAIALIGKSIARDGRAAVAHNSLGVAYHALARLDEATASYRRALALDPRFAEAWSNLGNTLHQQGDFKGAEDSYRRALAIAPETAEIHNNFGTTLYDQGDFKGAEEHYRQALRLRPDYPDAHFHLAGIHLRRGDFAVGWREYEWRWRMKRFVMPARPFKQPQWHGEPLNGARILIHAEQGFGDSLQFIRYVPLVAERGGKVVLEVPRELLRLFAGIAGAE